MTSMEELFSRSAAILTVNDALETMMYYVETLGFRITYTRGSPPYYGIVKRDEDVCIHFSEREDTRGAIHPCNVYIVTTDADAVYEEYRGKGVDIPDPPENREHGMREFDVRDPNGHFLTFGQAI